MPFFNKYPIYSVSICRLSHRRFLSANSPVVCDKIRRKSSVIVVVGMVPTGPAGPPGGSLKMDGKY